MDSEKINDRNDRAIRQVCKYYSQHLPSIKIVLLSDDGENLEKARREGIMAASCRQYVESMSRPELVDRIAAKEEKKITDELDEKQLTDLTRKNKHIIFPEHWKLSDIQAGLKSGKLFQGAYQSSRENYLEANVFLNDNEKYPQIFLQGYRNLNRAVHDDTVAVELLPESEWATPTSLILEEGEEDVGDYINEKCYDTWFLINFTVKLRKIAYYNILQSSEGGEKKVVSGQTKKISYKIDGGMDNS
ncbi:exosome complex exonuclease RRP44 isoform X2 [Brachionus plicatilis]|uniref:Exosome complex exonuclease RRP44 isoform X2 n=1 Tax=Brachionus plicatilis TaxID=10195 RepID=A0A3M7P4U0_BRAPC|nr:exosome complex exonuclease RRP44 isoform X2 [Brachionus plicatilis]